MLLPDANAARAQWRWRLHDFQASNADVRANLLAQLATEQMLPATRRRLELLRTHLETHEQRLTALLAEAGVRAEKRGAPDSAAVPGEGTITAHYEQLHRDWSWDADGNTEAAEAAEAVAAVLPADAALGRMLVLGAGAARLARDVHVRHRATSTLALDINPLPFVVARRVLAGQSVELLEFPVRPARSDLPCVNRVLRSDQPVAEGVRLLVADGLAPPVAPGSFDTVLTPWFVDQVPRDAATLLPVIHAALREGGTWIQFGPLIYQPHHTRLAHRYCQDELAELTAAAGFVIERSTAQRMGYLQSPAGSQGRTELVITWAARKAGPPAPRAPAETPPWLVDLLLPVPRLPGMDAYVAPHAMFAAIVALVDGRRCVLEIASVLANKHGLPGDRADAAVQTALKMIAAELRG
ncbi:MAG: hypothetical protein WKG00_30715 [Polyangiaceae bacterium]